MFHAFHLWLLAGGPPHYVYFIGAYAIGCFILSKIPKVRANETIEAFFNLINPKLVPLVKAIPYAGPLLAGFLDLWDTPHPKPKAVPVDEVIK